MSDDHDDSPIAARVRELEAILEEKGLLDAAELDRALEAFAHKASPANGFRVVARAWVDDDFKAKLKETGVNQFGSGWSWLVHDGSGLAVVGSANQDNPISKGQTPLLGVDVWEHAYYLKYQNKRPDYIDAWWNTVDWSKVAERFAAAGG